MKKANLLLATMLLALSVASFAQPDMKETVAMIKTNLLQSKEKVKQYAWIETTKTYIKGELKSTKQNQCYYSVDGQLTKVATGASEQAMIIRAGPAAKADAKKRGAIMADSQKCRPGRPQYNMAVTVWMETAKGMDRYTKKYIHLGGCTCFLSAVRITQPQRILRNR